MNPPVFGCYVPLSAKAAEMMEWLVSIGQMRQVTPPAPKPPSRPKLRTRSDINRENALKRWRRPRDEGKAKAQRELPVMQVVAGNAGKGAAARCEIQTDCEIASVCTQPVEIADQGLHGASPKLKLNEELRSSKLASLAAKSDSDFVQVTKAANAVANLDVERTQDYGQVRAWLKAGIPACLIVIIAEVLPKPDIQHLGYFGPAIREAFGGMEPRADRCLRSRNTWSADLYDWVRDGRIGPMPRFVLHRPSEAQAAA